MIDPLLAASRGESAGASERPKPRRAAPSTRDQAPRAERQSAPRAPAPRDPTGSQPLTILDDPSLELGSGAIRRPRVVDDPLFDDDLLFPPDTADQPEQRAEPVAPAPERADRAPAPPETAAAPPEPASAATVQKDADEAWLDEMLDRGPTVLPVIVPAEREPVVEPPPAPTPAPTPPPPPAPAPAPPDIVPTVIPSVEPTVAVPNIPPIGGALTILGEDSPDQGLIPVPAREVVAPRPQPAVTLQRRHPRVRRVTRVVRHVDTWSVFKVALVFNLFLYFVALTSGVLLWQVAQNTGTVDNIERFFESFGWKSFVLHGGEIFHNAWVAGLFGVIGLTGLAVLMATLFNLITDLVGGIRVTVLEEEVVAREDRGVGWRSAIRNPLRPKGDSQPS